MFDAFILRILPDPDVRDFVQRFLGSTLSGLTGDQVLPVFHGGGANGKTVLTEAVSFVLGDYATVTPFETLTARRDNAAGPSPDLADLVGARLVLATEPAEGARLNVALVKQLTGQDRIKARKLYGHPFIFRPQFKLCLVGNHRPEIQDNTHAAWRRLLLVPFTVAIPPEERDIALLTKLQAEADGVLQWLYRGYSAWREQGLKPPRAVVGATEVYRADEDAVGRFVSECCQVGVNYAVKATPLYQCYRAWATAANELVMSQKRFGDRLAERGFTNTKSGTVTWFGLALHAEQPPAPDDPDDRDPIS